MTTSESLKKLQSETAPIAICPDCLKAGHLLDPRANNPNLKIIEIKCLFHSSAINHAPSRNKSNITENTRLSSGRL